MSSAANDYTSPPASVVPATTTTTSGVAKPPVPLATTGADTVPFVIAGLTAFIIGVLFVLVAVRWAAKAAR